MTSRPSASAPWEVNGEMGSAHFVIPAICFCVVEASFASLPVAIGMIIAVMLLLILDLPAY